MDNVKNSQFQKWSWTKLMPVYLCKFYSKMLKEFRESERFFKFFLSINFEKFTHLFNPVENVSPVL